MKLETEKLLQKAPRSIRAAEKLLAEGDVDFAPLGEFLALQWGDVDWNANRIYVRRSIFWYLSREAKELGIQGETLWRFTTPKSKRSRRAIVLSPRLKEALELHRLQCPVSPHDLVFCTLKGTPLQYRNQIRREFEPALARAGLRKIRFHDLRHTYTALLIAQGAHAKFIQSQLGHASIQTTLDRYGHLLPEAQIGAGEKLDTQIFGLTPKSEGGQASDLTGVASRG